MVRVIHVDNVILQLHVLNLRLFPITKEHSDKQLVHLILRIDLMSSKRPCSFLELVGMPCIISVVTNNHISVKIQHYSTFFVEWIEFLALILLN